MTIGINAVLHINVNCTGLDRSVEFYRQVAGLTPISHTAPESPQPGGAFGLDSAQWDAWIMAGPLRFERPVVDLLEWKVPPPSGRPARRGQRLGFEALRLSVPDVEAALATATSLGGATTVRTGAKTPTARCSSWSPAPAVRSGSRCGARSPPIVAVLLRGDRAGDRRGHRGTRRDDGVLL